MSGVCALMANGSAFVAVHRAYTSGSGTDTIPSGCSLLVIRDWGGGAGGKGGPSSLSFSPGGGGGAEVKKTLTIGSSDWGKTFNYSVGAAGVGGITGNLGTPGGDSTVTNGTYTHAVSLTAGGGTSTAGSGVGGTPSGGDVNTNGNNSGTNPVPGAAIVDNSDSAGAGGPGAFNTANGANGSAGKITFDYT